MAHLVKSLPGIQIFNTYVKATYSRYIYNPGVGEEEDDGASTLLKLAESS